MARITSYATLIAEIDRMLDGATTDDDAAGFIQRAEEKFNTRIYSLETEDATTGTTVADTAYIALPTGYAGMISIRIEDNPPLTQLSPNDFQTKWHEASSALPENWAIIDSQIYFGPTPDAAYTVNINCLRTLTPLSDDDPSNWLLERHSRLYLHASLVEASISGWEDARAATFNGLVEQVIGEINASDARKRRGNLIETVAAEYF